MSIINAGAKIPAPKGHVFVTGVTWNITGNFEKKEAISFSKLIALSSKRVGK